MTVKEIKSQSRLDFILSTADLVYLTKESNIMLTPFSDHSAIVLNRSTNAKNQGLVSGNLTQAC